MEKIVTDFGVTTRPVDVETKPGIDLRAPQGERFFTGEQTALVTPEDLQKNLDTPMVLLSDRKAWGVLSLTSAEQISRTAFKNRAPLHRITEQERMKRWPDVDKFWFYETKFLPFTKPISARWKKANTIVKAGGFELSEEPLQKEFKLIVSLVMIWRNDKVLLLKRARPPLVWSPPGGIIKAGESVCEAAERETLEETGVRFTDCERFGFIATDDSNIHLATARWLAGTPRLTEENTDFRWATLEEVEELGVEVSPPPSFFKQSRERLLAKQFIGLVEISPQALRQMSDEDLLAMHDRLHALWAEREAEGEPESEDLLNAHILVTTEMGSRGLIHEDADAFDERSREFSSMAKRGPVPFRQKEVREFFDKLPNEFVFIPDFVSLTGSMLYAQKGREPHDVDWVIKLPQHDDKIGLKLARLTFELARKGSSLIWEPFGANWSHCSFYDLVVRKKPEPEFRRVQDRDFERFYKLLKQELVEESRLITVGKPFKPYSVAGEFFPGQENILFDQFINRALERGTRVLTQKKFDGIRMLIHKRGDDVSIMTESGRERSVVFPKLADLIRQLPAREAILDAEFVEWDDLPKPRHEMIWMVVAKEPREARIVMSAHDLVWLDGKNIWQTPYRERLAMLAKLLPRPLTLKDELQNLRLEIAESREIKDQRSFNAALRWARTVPGSEGAMLKFADFQYKIEGAVADVVKFKNVVEMDVQVIGWRKVPKGRPASVRWTREQALRNLESQLEESETFVFRIAVQDDDGKLVPLEADAKLTPGELEIDWDEERQRWRGLEDPKLWTMCEPFEQREAGEYKYAVTFAFKPGLEPKCGLILTESPVLIRPFEKEDGTIGYSHTFPVIRNVRETAKEPGRLRDILIAFGHDPDEFLKFEKSFCSYTFYES